LRIKDEQIKETVCPGYVSKNYQAFHQENKPKIKINE